MSTTGRINGYRCDACGDWMADWEARCMRQHEAEVAEGLHDDRCEYGRKLKRSILMLCHCSKRRRERVGFTTPPTQDLYFPPPSTTVYEVEDAA